MAALAGRGVDVARSAGLGLVAGSNAPRRLIALAIVASVLMSLLVVRVWFLQAVTADETEEIISRVRTRTIRLLPERGRIFDVNGRIVADNKRILTVAIDRAVVRDADDRAVMFERVSFCIMRNRSTYMARRIRPSDARMSSRSALMSGFQSWIGLRPACDCWLST